MWVHEYVILEQNQWQNDLLTDESQFGLYLDSQRVRFQHIQQVHNYRGGTIIIWTGILLDGRTELVFLDRFLLSEN